MCRKNVAKAYKSFGLNERNLTNLILWFFELNLYKYWLNNSSHKSVLLFYISFKSLEVIICFANLYNKIKLRCESKGSF